MNKIYPFKFLDAYTKEDVDIFFGRGDEIKALYEMTFQTNILLVYGASGTGKTSLIQCGLASKFQSHDWLALTIRRVGNINTTLEKTLSDASGLGETGNTEADWFEEIMNDSGEEATTAPPSAFEKYFKAIYLKNFRPIYLIFDQFEELFILGDQDEQTHFIQTVQEILKVDQPVKMIFSIREEYLGHLYAFEKAVPQLLRKKLRVEPMNLPKVKEVILGATSSGYSKVQLLKVEDEKFAEGVFNKIRGNENTLTIQLPYLQVFLDKLYFEITKDETREADAVFSVEALNKMGDIGDVLRAFLEDQVKSISQTLSKKYPTVTLETIWKILSPFATLEGTKKPISKASLFEQMPEFDHELIMATIEAFVNTRILRYSEEKDFYEIAHDSLAKRIFEKRSDEDIALLEVKRLIENQTSVKESAREYFSEKQLNFIEPYLNKIKLTDEENQLIIDSHKEVRKKKNKRTRRVFLTIAGLNISLAFMIILSINLFYQRKTAFTALETIIKTQAVAKAKEQGDYGESYQALGKVDFARASYQSALVTMKNYPNDSLYAALLKKLFSCKK